MNHKPYILLGVAVGINFLIMFALTYVGVYRLNDIFINLNRFYMALAMVAPMVIVMLVVMSHMFHDKKLNIALYTVSALIMTGALLGIRGQFFIGDKQFLKSMIPHHSIAVKTCTYANLDDPEVKELCKQIIASQEKEIAQMKSVLQRMSD